MRLKIVTEKGLKKHTNVYEHSKRNARKRNKYVYAHASQNMTYILKYVLPYFQRKPAPFIRNNFMLEMYKYTA